MGDQSRPRPKLEFRDQHFRVRVGHHVLRGIAKLNKIPKPVLLRAIHFLRSKDSNELLTAQISPHTQIIHDEAMHALPKD